MHFNVFHLALFAIATSTNTLAAPSPKTANILAGGPAIVPIPSTCTLTNPAPAASGYKPAETFISDHLLYSAYFSPNLNATAQATQCFEQCYGYGDKGVSCKSAILAYQVPSDGAYGSDAGELMTGCLLFDRVMREENFAKAEKGQWVDERAANVEC